MCILPPKRKDAVLGPLVDEVFSLQSLNLAKKRPPEKKEFYDRIFGYNTKAISVKVQIQEGESQTTIIALTCSLD